MKNAYLLPLASPWRPSPRSPSLKLRNFGGVHTQVALPEHGSLRDDHKLGVQFFTHKREPAAVRFDLSFDYLPDLVDAILCELFVCDARGPCDGSDEGLPSDTLGSHANLAAMLCT